MLLDLASSCARPATAERAPCCYTQNTLEMMLRDCARPECTAVGQRMYYQYYSAQNKYRWDTTGSICIGFVLETFQYKTYRATTELRSFLNWEYVFTLFLERSLPRRTLLGRFEEECTAMATRDCVPHIFPGEHSRTSRGCRSENWNTISAKRNALTQITQPNTVVFCKTNVFCRIIQNETAYGLHRLHFQIGHDLL